MIKPYARSAGSIVLVIVTAICSAAFGQKGSKSDEGCAKNAGSFASGPGPITAVWANDGGDKITMGELRTRGLCQRVRNRTWDGSQVTLSGAANETVSFNLVLEAAHEVATGISVAFDQLTGPNGHQIRGSNGSTQDIFDWRPRDIALYFVRYLPIKGLSLISYDTYDERHIPERMRRPHSADGEGSGGWTDRPDHDALYPDIAVPIELEPRFNIQEGTNQSVWIDVYIPKDTPPGRFAGEVRISQSQRLLYSIPITLQVRPFALPDEPAVHAFAATSYEDIAGRYTGTTSPKPHSAQDDLVRKVAARQAQLAQRHRIELVDNNGGAKAWSNMAPRDYWMERFTGELFTESRGYRGPGMGRGSSIFSIGTFGVWRSWLNTDDKQQTWQLMDAWEMWFRKNAAQVERFLYLADEPGDLAQVERLAATLKANTGAGGSLPLFTTVSLLEAVKEVPSANLIASLVTVGDTPKWEAAVAHHTREPSRKFMLYNGRRPATGSFAIEDDGVALRQLAWSQYKKDIARWFYWEVTYYDDYQGARGPTDVFKNAQTFGGAVKPDPILGLTGWNASNGDGVLMYPGTDALFPGSSYGVEGPFASLRLKHWRRGIEDAAYLRLARRADPQRTQAILERMIPKVLWEYGVADPADPTWMRTDISWSTDPDVWEAARAELADIIQAGVHD